MPGNPALDLVADGASLEELATAAQACTACEPSTRVTKDRGEIRVWDGRDVLVTIHPSSLLRDRERRSEQMEAFVRDLTLIAPYLN